MGGITHQDQLAILAHAPKPISTTSRLIKCEMRHKRRMTLTSSDHACLTDRVDGDEVVLPSDGDKAGIG